MAPWSAQRTSILCAANVRFPTLYRPWPGLGVVKSSVWRAIAARLGLEISGPEVVDTPFTPPFNPATTPLR